MREGQAPLSHGSELKWVGFSEEGQLMSLSDAGVVSALSLESGWWSPILDLKVKMAATAS